MSIFYPDYYFRRVYEIQPDWLQKQNISVLLLDIDNTLTTHDNPEVPPEVSNWVIQMQQAGMKLLILSNNKPARVEPFAAKLGVDYIANAAKPLSGGIWRACERLGVGRSGLAIVGDQIFTDILCGKWVGITSILVEPIELENHPFFQLKRELEKMVLIGWRKGG